MQFVCFCVCFCGLWSVVCGVETDLDLDGQTCRNLGTGPVSLHGFLLALLALMLDSLLVFWTWAHFACLPLSSPKLKAEVERHAALFHSLQKLDLAHLGLECWSRGAPGAIGIV